MIRLICANGGDCIGIGKQIGEIAKLKGISLKELSRMAAVPYTSVYSIVSRDSDRMDGKTLLKIVHALGIDIYSLVDFDEATELLAADSEKRYKLLYELFGEDAETINKISLRIMQLNDEGQRKADERIEELTEIQKYKKDPQA